MKLVLREQLRQLSRLILRCAREDRITVEVNQKNTTAAKHQPPCCHRRIDTARKETGNSPAHTNRHSTRAEFLPEVIERVLGERLYVNRELGIAQVDIPLPGLFDAAADLAFDLGRRQWKALVRTARRHPERSRVGHPIE